MNIGHSSDFLDWPSDQVIVGLFKVTNQSESDEIKIHQVFAMWIHFNIWHLYIIWFEWTSGQFHEFMHKMVHNEFKCKLLIMIHLVWLHQNYA